MRVAVFSTCPANTYSGGRYHALIAAYCLARLGHEVWFVTDNHPVFDDDLKSISPNNPVKITLVNDFEVSSSVKFDVVMIAPQLTPRRSLYQSAVRLAHEHDASLAMFCYETANWFNTTSVAPRPVEAWSEWKILPSQGALILCSANESRKYAKEFFDDLPPETKYDVWQPALNSVAKDAAPDSTERNRILMFVRPLDPHKGSQTISHVLQEDLGDNILTLVIGNPRNSEKFVKETEKLAKETGNNLEFHFGLSDIEKFELLKQSKVVLFPTSFEGYGYPPIEALATGAQCITYDLSVIRENCEHLAHYVPIGDVERLRETLRDVLSGAITPPDFSHDRIRFLSDIDVRARELEKVLTEYDEARKNTRPYSDRNPVSVEIGEVYKADVNGETILTTVVKSNKQISQVVAPQPHFEGATVIRRFWTSGAWWHQLYLKPHPTTKLDEVSHINCEITYFDGGAVSLEVDTTSIRNSLLKESTDRAVNIHKIQQTGNSNVVFGWGLAAAEYDQAVWYSSSAEGGTRIFDGDIALSTTAYQSFIDTAERIACGLTFRLPDSALKADYNAIILMRNGRPVAIRSIDSERIEQVGRKPGTDLADSLTFQPDIHDDIPDLEANGPRLFKSKCQITQDFTTLRLWSNVVNAPCDFEVKIRPKSGPTSSIFMTGHNTRRKDVSKERDLKTSDVGFSLNLPSEGLANSQISVKLSANGYLLDSIDRISLEATDGSDQPRRRPEIVSTALEATPMDSTYEVVNILPEANLTKIEDGKQPKMALSTCEYDGAKGQLSLKGWVLDDGAVTVVVLDRETNELYASSSKRTPRPDVARKFERTDHDQYGFSLTSKGQIVDATRLVLRIITEDGYFDRSIDRAKLVGVKEFQIIDNHYDPNWKMLWVRGTFVGPNLPLAKIELIQGGETLCEGATNVKQMRHGDPLAGWRFETMLDGKFDEELNVTFRATTINNLQIEKELKLISKPPVISDKDQVKLAIAETGIAEAEKTYLPQFQKGSRKRVLLIVHNLDAVDRPEKLDALKSIHSELDRQGVELVILHHSKNQYDAEIPEINFFDEAVNVFSEDYETQRASEGGLDIKFERAQVRKLFGFMSTINRTPKSWADCEKQIQEEIRKLTYVIDRVNADAILLWHQWNSLMEIGRHLANEAGIPSAYLHEGMLPKTLTFDPKGMMAEASCVGATLPEDVEDKDTWLERADAAIHAIAEGKLDRKPLSQISAISEIRRRCNDMGRKLVFVAGINDWHSGNLPRSGDENVHSPYFKDTYDALQAVSELAERNNWVVMFKPHPNLYPRFVELPPSVVVVRESNSLDCLLESDVTVTILSSIAYIALANKKPVVLLGRNTLSGAGCVQEVQSQAAVAPAINAAFDDQRFADQQEKFRLHIAELLRSYLYQYDPEDSLAHLSHEILGEHIKEKLLKE